MRGEREYSESVTAVKTRCHHSGWPLLTTADHCWPGRHETLSLRAAQLDILLSLLQHFSTTGVSSQTPWTTLCGLDWVNKLMHWSSPKCTRIRMPQMCKGWCIQYHVSYAALVSECLSCIELMHKKQSSGCVSVALKWSILMGSSTPHLMHTAGFLLSLQMMKNPQTILPFTFPFESVWNITKYILSFSPQPLKGSWEA